MSLTTQQWRYVGSQSFATGTVAAMLDALYTLGTKTTYDDGTTRTAGAGSAWTWSRYQNASVTEACYATPPTDTLNQRIILAGQASGGTKTPTMASPDTSATVIVMAGINKNSGAFNAWDNASPFTSGTFSGYWRMWPGSAGAGNVYLWESQECVVVVVNTSSGTCYACLLGAWVDPESPDTTSDAESDGKLYGMAVSGSGAAWATSMWTAGGTADFFVSHETGASQSHAMVFQPGGSTLYTCSIVANAQSSMTTTGLKTASGRWGRLDLATRRTAAAPNDVILGRLREIFMFSDGTCATKQTNAGSTIGYIVSARTDTSADGFFLLH